MLAKELPTNNRLSSLVLPMFLVIIVLMGYIWMSRPKPIALDRPIQNLVVQQIQGVSELTSAIVNTEQIVEKGENGAGFLWHDRKVLYVAKGKVRIGIDLNEIDESSVSVQGTTVSLALPPLRVLESELDSEKSYVYSVDAGLIPATQDILNLVRKAQLQAKTQIAEAACSAWVIEAANERIRKTVDQILTPVLKPLGYEATVKTQPFSLTSCSNPKAEAKQK
jgi:hypothetical protein